MKPSRRELGLHFGTTLESGESQVEAAAALVADGSAEHVALTLGGEGAVLASTSGILRLAVPRGDGPKHRRSRRQFLAAFVLRLAQGRTLEESLRAAVAAGSATVTTAATELCHRDGCGTAGGRTRRAGLGRRRRTVKAGPARLAVALLLALATAGCSGQAPIACPAIAWFNSLTVSLDGAVENVSRVEFCAEDVCSVRRRWPGPRPRTLVSPGPVPPPVATLPDVPPPAAPGRPRPACPVRAALQPLHGVPGRRPDLEGQPDDAGPEDTTITAYSADGSVLARRDVELGWTRVGGSEACGGPGTAGPVRLVI